MHKVLVIDDQEIVTKFIKRALELGGKYEVATVNKASAAHGTARTFKPDVILLDMLMPGANGGEVAAEINGDPDLAKVPIVFLTGIVDERGTGSRGLRTGGRRVLAKPITVEELRSLVAETLEDAGVG